MASLRGRRWESGGPAAWESLVTSSVQGVVILRRKSRWSRRKFLKPWGEGNFGIGVGSVAGGPGGQ